MQSGCTLEQSGVGEHNTLVVDEDAPDRGRWPTVPVQAAPPPLRVSSPSSDVL